MLRFDSGMNWVELRRFLAHIKGGSAVPTLICANGFEMSVQASKYHYCSPRETTSYDMYMSYEVGFPTHWDDFPSKPSADVMGYVDNPTLAQVIQRNGGVIAIKI